MYKRRLFLLASLAVISFGCGPTGDSIDPEIVDDIVSSDIEDPEGTMTPLKAWLLQSENNKVIHFTREELLKFADRAADEFNVKLWADVMGTNSAFQIAADVRGVTNRTAFTQLCEASSAKYQVQVDYGHKYALLSIEVTEDGKPQKR